MPVRPRTTERVPKGAEGRIVGDHHALKRALRAARAKVGIESDGDLAVRAGVHLQTIQNWMYGKTMPRPSEMNKVARVLGLRLDELMAVYEGREPEPKPLQDSIRELVGSIDSLVEEMRRGRAVQAGVLEGIERGLTVAASIRGDEASGASNGQPSRDGADPDPARP